MIRLYIPTVCSLIYSGSWSRILIDSFVNQLAFWLVSNLYRFHLSTNRSFDDTQLLHQIFNDRLKLRLLTELLSILYRPTGISIRVGFTTTLFVQLSVLYIPTRRSANSNILFRRLMIINCAFFVRSYEKLKNYQIL